MISTEFALFAIVLNVAAVFAGVKVAEARNVSVGLAVVLCILLGFVGLLIVALLPSEPDYAAGVLQLEQQRELERERERRREAMEARRAPRTTHGGAAGVAGELERLASMRERGLLTEEEFVAAKRRLLQ